MKKRTVPATEAEAVQLLSEGGVPVTAPDDDALPLRRVAICQRLMDACRDPKLPELRWNSPILSLLFEPQAGDEDMVDEYVWIVEEEVFGLHYLDGEEEGIQTFGDLALHIEGRLRDLWRGVEPGRCASQTVFYALRQAMPARPDNWYNLRRLRPGVALETCLPAQDAQTTEPLRTLLLRRYGVGTLPTEFRVFGRLEFGATWLTVYFVTFFAGGIALTDTVDLHPIVFITALFAWAAIVAWLLSLVSRPVWRGVHTLGDLVRWTLRENTDAMRRLNRALTAQD